MKYSSAGAFVLEATGILRSTAVFPPQKSVEQYISQESVRIVVRLYVAFQIHAGGLTILYDSHARDNAAGTSRERTH